MRQTFSESKGRVIVLHRGSKGWTYWARVLMENEVGRELATHEVVHHINGDKRDDRIENLQLLTYAEHAKIHHAETIAAKNAKRTHCKRGHALMEDNLVPWRPGKCCRTCHLQESREYKRQRREQKAVLKTLETRAMVGSAILKAQGRG